MAITDQSLLDDLQRATIEGPPAPDNGVSWPSGLWTRDEVIAYLNQRQQRLLQETLVVASWRQQALIPNQPIQPLPDEWLATEHAMVETDNTVTPLEPLSRAEADLTIYGWQQQMSRPLGYIELSTGTLSWELLPTPIAGGLIHIFGSWLAQVLDGNGTTFEIPDELTPYIFYGALADMFGKQGRAYDKARYEYCEDRYQEGIAVARAMFEAIRLP